MTKGIAFAFSWIFLVGCLKSQSASEGRSHGKDSLIVFYNVKEISRGELANSLEVINSFGPKVVAIETVFEELKNPKEDSILASVLAKLDEVVFCADITGPDSVIGKTHEFFRRPDFKEGLLSYLVDEDGITREYVPLFQDEEAQRLSFPDMIVFSFRPETISRYVRMDVNRPVKINYMKRLEDFHVIDKNTLTPELIANKIIVVGFLESGKDDYFNIDFNNTNTKTYPQVITANIILNILSEHDTNILDD